jgi:hypothetical protein
MVYAFQGNGPHPFGLWEIDGNIRQAGLPFVASCPGMEITSGRLTNGNFLLIFL